jgi:hypothetical protein
LHYNDLSTFSDLMDHSVIECWADL